MYSCLVTTPEPISDQQIDELNALIDVKIAQQTPLRVLHRRTLMERTKVIHRLRVEKITERQYLVFVLSSAGTYIKEFIHGDLQRTFPNFGSLCNLPGSDIIQLDVMDIFTELSPESLMKFSEICDKFGAKSLTIE